MRTAVAAGATLIALVLSGCGSGDADAGSGGGSDPQAWLDDNCSVLTHTSGGGEEGVSTFYQVGVGYAMKDFPLYVNQSSEGNIAPAEVTLPADLRVCFKADDQVKAHAADGSGTLTIMAIAWDEHPDFDLFVKVSGYGYEDEETCRLDVDETTASCEGDDRFFQVDRERSAELQE